MAENRVLSIDIGLQTTRICEVDIQKKSTKVYQCLAFDTPENTIEDGYIRDKEAFAVVMKEKLAEAKIKNNNVIFTISSAKIANREVIIPYVKEDKIRPIIEANASDYFPVDVSEYIISYTILEKTNTKETKQIRLLVLAAPVNMIKNYYNFAELMDFNIQSIDYSGNSTFQLIRKQVNVRVSLTIQINEQSTLINILHGQTLLLQRIIPYGTNSVIEAVMESPIAHVETEKEALLLLENESMINTQLAVYTGEAAVTTEVSSGSYDQIRETIKAKNEITESLEYLISNTTRVIDYFNAKHKGIKIEAIYLTGQGCRIKGISHLFANETELEVKKITRLYGVDFQKSANSPGTDESEYLPCIGATIKPVNFVPKEHYLQEKKQVAIHGMKVVFFASLVFCVVLIGSSYFFYQAASKENEILHSRAAELSSINDVFDVNTQVTANLKEAKAMYALSVSQNEKLNEIITALEKNFTVSTKTGILNVTEAGFSLNIETISKESAAKLLMQLKSMKDLISVTASTVTDTQGEDGVRTVDFSVDCVYNITDGQEENNEGVK